MKLQDVLAWKKPPVTDVGAAGSRAVLHDTWTPIRLGIWILVIGFGSLLLWSAFAPLDEGVPCSGTVSIATKRKVVQHLMGGTVEKVFVEEGQEVRKGDILILLDSKNAKARYAEVHQHYLGRRAEESRLLAEQGNALRVAFHKDLLHDPDTRLASELMVTQRNLFNARRRTLRIYEQQLMGLRDLLKDGYASLSQAQELELKIASLQAESASQLAQVQKEVQADEEKSRALAQELAETEIRSPATGQVVGLQVQTVGAVIQSGQKVMDIVPLDNELILEAKVAPHLIDMVHPGLVANVQFASFAHAPQLVVPGRVVSISGDLLSDPPSGSMPSQSYYLARVAVTAEGLDALGRHKMQPGMPVQVVIKTGERSVLTYILHPLLKRMASAMKEE